MLKALIVDDDIATADVIRDKVGWGSLGIDEVFTAYNIENAMKILEASDISIVISDIEMPGGSGLELLKWFREKKMKGEFLLLTCHEKFDYAKIAVELQATEFLLKPFDVNVMEAALKKIIMRYREKLRIEDDVRLGKWAHRNQNQLQLSFLRMVLTGRLSSGISDEVKARELDIDCDAHYRLIVSKITDFEKDCEKMGLELFNFALENIHSEILYGIPSNSSVVSFSEQGRLFLVCPVLDNSFFKEKAEELVSKIRRLLDSTITVCVSKVCKISEFCETLNETKASLGANVSYYGSWFYEEETAGSRITSDRIFDENRLLGFILDNNKAHFMSYLKSGLNEKLADRSVNVETLDEVGRELWMAVYAYLNRKNLDFGGFFRDEQSTAIMSKSNQSVMDMLKFAGYLLEQLYEYEARMRKAESITDKIEGYVHLHFSEPIGRNKIADELGLTPEYVSKLYKKETGNSLTDYISQYRVEQAKILLEKGNLTISEVADKCGFENFTYFSTIFKKYTGITPNQYKKGN